MKYIKMTYAQIENMVARQDGYDDVTEWKKDLGDMYTSIYDLVDVDNTGFSKSGARWYTFEDDRGRWCVWYRY